MDNNKINSVYFHRDYQNDFPKTENKEESFSATRVAKVALPFLALYRPFGQVLGLGLGVMRTATSLKDCLTAEDYKQFSMASFQTSLAVLSVAGTIFFHPVGMAINTLSDMGANVYHIYEAGMQGDMFVVSKEMMRTANNVFYLALLLTGSIQLQIASFGLQVLVESISSYDEWKKGNILEAVGHVGMSLVRMNQSATSIAEMQKNRQIIPISVATEKAGSSQMPSSPLILSKGRDIDSNYAFLKEQHQEYFSHTNLANDIKIKSYGAEGNKIAFWSVNNSFGGRDFVLSYFESSTGTWSSPATLQQRNTELNPIVDFQYLGTSTNGIATFFGVTANQQLIGISCNLEKGKWKERIYLGWVQSFQNVRYASDSKGNATLAWFSHPYKGNELFTASHFNSETGEWSDAEKIYKAGSGRFTYPHGVTSLPIISRDENGNVSFLTTQFYHRPGEDDESTNELFLTVFNSKENRWNDPTQLASHLTWNSCAQILSDGKGKFYIAWSEKAGWFEATLRMQVYDAQIGKLSPSIIVAERVNEEHSDWILTKNSNGEPAFLWNGEKGPEEVNLTAE